MYEYPCDKCKGDATNNFCFRNESILCASCDRKIYEAIESKKKRAAMKDRMYFLGVLTSIISLLFIWMFYCISVGGDGKIERYEFWLMMFFVPFLVVGIALFLYSILTKP